MVYEVYWQVARDAGVPIIGMGGVRSWRDVAEFHLAGATAVALGTATFIDPTTLTQAIDGLGEYLRRERLASVRELIGAAHDRPDKAPAQGVCAG
jgi:dihydroorotate dehydrogenase (NAD+) catalytic subunit